MSGEQRDRDRGQARRASYERSRSRRPPAERCLRSLRRLAHVKKSPSSPIMGSMPRSTAARSRPGSRSATAAVVVHKELGLVAQVFDEPTLAALQGDIAVGHSRYRRPVPRPGRTRSRLGRRRRPVALGHNGNLTNTSSWRARCRRRAATPRGTPPPTRTCSPRCSPGVAAPSAPSRRRPPGSAKRGAYSLVFIDENTLYAARDPQGFRPLVLGRLERNVAGSSPPRPPPSTSSAPASCARSSQAS